MNMKSYIHTMLSEIDATSTIMKDEHPGFLLTLMIISSYIIQADGKIMHFELEFLRDFLEKHYGTEKKAKYIDILLKLFDESKKYSHDDWASKIKECTLELNIYTTEEQRLLLMSYLIKIAKTDNSIDYKEVQSLRDIAEWLRVNLEMSEQLDNLKIEEVWNWVI